MSVLALNNVCFSYGKKPVLKDLTVEFEKGKMYCIVGKSGAEKPLCCRFYPDSPHLTAAAYFTTAATLKT